MMTRRRFVSEGGGGPIPGSQPKNGPITWKSLALAGFVGTGILGYYTVKREEKLTKTVQTSKTIGKALLGGPFSLVDSLGTPVTDKTFRGEWLVLYFGFTYCPDICPNELVKLGHVLKKLDKKINKSFVKKKPKITPLFISVDPKRDSCAQLEYYKKDFHPSIRFLTGTPDQVKRAAKAYRVYYSNTNSSSEEDDWDYLVDHSIVMYFVSPEGEFLEFFTQIAEVDEIYERMYAHIQSYDSSSSSSS